MLKAVVDTFRKARRRNEYCPVSLMLAGGSQLGMTMEKAGKHSIAKKEYEKCWQLIMPVYARGLDLIKKGVIFR